MNEVVVDWINYSDKNQLDWAIKYLDKKNIHNWWENNSIIILYNQDPLIVKSLRGDMKNAWRSQKYRLTTKANKRTRQQSFFISNKASKNLKNYAKKHKTSISNALTLLLEDKEVLKSPPQLVIPQIPAGEVSERLASIFSENKINPSLSYHSKCYYCWEPELFAGIVMLLAFYAYKRTNESNPDPSKEEITALLEKDQIFQAAYLEEQKGIPWVSNMLISRFKSIRDPELASELLKNASTI